MNSEKMDIPFRPEKVSEKLLAWYGQYGRDLPWRHTRDPYCIWLSEIMLQQTAVVTVIPYYEKFLESFPGVRSLALANQETVLDLWSGLGYYSRARNLHKAAQYVMAEWNGEFPETVDGLMNLSGVGRSTAGAIVSIAFDKQAPILDGNVRRVLVRLMALCEPPREKQSEKKLWQWAELLTSEARPHDYAQAIMDLGATICTPRQPDCLNCPLNALCQAREKGLENELPITTKKKKVPTRRQIVLIVDKDGQLLVRRRPATGLLGGMLEFPCIDLNKDSHDEEALRKLAAQYSPGENPEFVGKIGHVYSHFRLEAKIYRTRLRHNDKIAEDESFWHDTEKLTATALHGAHQKALTLIMKEPING